MNETRIQERAFPYEDLIWYELLIEVNGMIYKESRGCKPEDYNEKTIEDYRELCFQRIGKEFSMFNDIPTVKEREY